MVMNLTTRLVEVSRVLLAFLGLNLVLANAMLPFLAFAMFTDALAGYPLPVIVVVGAGAWALAGPGVAAAFATFRDAHLMRLAEPQDAREARAALARDVDAVAPSYWRDAEDTRIVRPFLRTYARLLVRSLAVSVVVAAAVAALLVSALTALRVTPVAAEAATSVLFAVGAFALVSGLVALSLIVQLPRARPLAAVRAAVQLTARRPVLAVLAVAVLGVYAATLLVRPLLILSIGSALLFFFAAHLAQAITQPVVDAITAEERTARTTGTSALVPVMAPAI